MGTSAAVDGECAIESVGAIHESPAAHTTDIAPHQSLPCARGGGQNLFILAGGVVIHKESANIS